MFMLALIAASLSCDFPKKSTMKKALSVAYPGSCDSQKDISYLDSYEISLRKGENACFLTKGTLFLNGEVVKLTAYDNDKMLVQAYGVAITAGTPSSSHNYIIKVESDIDQTVTVIGNLALTVGNKIYVTTNPLTKKMNILENAQKSGTTYTGYFLQLCTAKTSISFNIRNGDTLSINGLKKTGSGTTIYEHPKSLLLIATSQSSNRDVSISLESTGQNWITPYSGYLTIKEKHVYTEFGDLEPPKSDSNNDIPIGVGTSVAIVVVVLIIAGVIYFLKKKSNKDKSSSSSSSSSSK